MKNFEKVVLCSVLLFAFSVSIKASNLVVKTYPDGYRDSDIAYLYKDKISTICFYLFTSSDKLRIEMGGKRLFLELPEGIEIISYGFFNHRKFSKYYDMAKSKRENSFVWQLNCEKGTVDKKFAPTRGTVYSFYHIYVYLKPTGNINQDKFTIRWKFKDDETTLAEGRMKVELLMSPKGRKNPKNFIVWTEAGYDSEIMDNKEFNNWLDIAKEGGITGIIQAMVPNKGVVPLRDLETIKKRGFTLVDRTILSKPIKAFSKYPKEDKYYHVGLDNARAKRMDIFKRGLRVSYISWFWCPSVRVAGGSQLLKMLTDELKQAYRQGFRYFFVDYEQRIYSSCFCNYCKKSFARYINADEEEILKMKPLEIIYKYPLKWYKFKSWQTGNLFRAIKDAVEKDCPEIKVGLNSQISYPGVYTKNLGYGMIWFCEDPRFTDFGVDFHDTDTIKGGLEDIIRLDLLFRPQDSYGIKIKKPIIARAGAFCDINWNYFCVVGRRAWARQKGMKMGTEKRGDLIKLEIANMAAMGVKGVEIPFASDITDARIANDVDKAMEFVAEFEDIFLSGARSDDKRVQVYNLTDSPSPYDQIGPKGYYDHFYFYGPGKKYGFIQYKVWQLEEELLVPIFNWDFYQTKKIQVKVPKIGEGKFYVYIFKNGERYLLSKLNRGRWNAKELQEGISIDIEPGGMLGILISQAEKREYSHIIEDKLYSSAGKKPIDLYAWRKKPNNPTTESFEKYIYNRGLKSIQRKHPNLVPEKYIK